MVPMGCCKICSSPIFIVIPHGHQIETEGSENTSRPEGATGFSLSTLICTLRKYLL